MRAVRRILSANHVGSPGDAPPAPQPPPPGAVAATCPIWGSLGSPVGAILSPSYCVGRMSALHDDRRRGEIWGVAELVDLEAQIFDDQARDEKVLRERDEAIGRALRTDPPSSRNEILAGWVHAIRAKSDAQLPGKGIEGAYGQANAVLAAILFLVGFASAWGILRFGGEHPINVLVVFGVFVFAQVLALLVTILSFAAARLAPGVFENRPLVVLVRAGVGWLWKSARAKLPRHDKAEATINRLRSRRSLYPAVERNLLFTSLQVAGVAFNLGVLLAFLTTVTFTDLAFGWSTTLRVGADELARACRILATPWRGWLEEATASIELIRATQYSRLEGAYLETLAGSGVRDPTRYGEWWRFLVASVVTYGLLPRIVLVALGRWMRHTTLKRLPPNTPEVERLIFRLTSPSVQRVHRDDPGNVRTLGEGYEPIRQPRRNLGQSRVLCVRWREAEIPRALLEAFLTEHYGVSMEGELGSAGSHDYQDDQEFLRRVSDADDLPVFMIVEPWTSPDRSVRRFLQELRERAGKDRIVNVILTAGAGPDNRRIWAGYLSELADPYLALDPDGMAMTEAPSE